MNPEVEFLFDYGSPFSYLANLQIEGFAKRNGAAVTYTPILLGAVLKATGNASPMTVPARVAEPGGNQKGLPAQPQSRSSLASQFAQFCVFLADDWT